jgi:hypothetical protein
MNRVGCPTGHDFKIIVLICIFHERATCGSDPIQVDSYLFGRCLAGIGA